MTPVVKIEGISVVLVGNFNPSIFHPAWFDQNKLLRPKEIEAAQVELVHPELTLLNIDWLGLHITQGRFQATTQQELYYPILRDLLVSTFTLLPHTPVRTVGVNRDCHLHLGSAEREALLGALAPLGKWDSLLGQPELGTMRIQGKRDDDTWPGQVSILLEPSTRVAGGVYININDSFPLTPEHAHGNTEVRELLSKAWDDMMSRAKRLVGEIIKRGSL